MEIQTNNPHALSNEGRCLALFTLLCVLAGCCRSIQPPFLDGWARSDGLLLEEGPPGKEMILSRELPLRFMACGWHALVGLRGDGPSPPEPFERLYLRFRNRVSHIANPGDFSGLGAVRLKNENDAIAFVQLFTSHNTFHLFDSPNALDVLPSGPRNGRYLSGFFGTIDNQVYTNLGLFPPKVERVTDGFEVRRFLLRRDPQASGCAVVRYEERVSREGDYRLLSTAQVGHVSDNDVFFPMFQKHFHGQRDTD